MYHDNFEIIWQQELSQAFNVKSPGLFIPDDRSQVLQHTRLHPASHLDTTLSLSSESTFVDHTISSSSAQIREDVMIENVSQLEQYQTASHRSKFFFIDHISNSFSVFSITLAVFNRLCRDLRTASALRNLIKCMASQPRDEVAAPLPYCQSFTVDNMRSVELCYALRYPAKHGRTREDPWSIRQFAVHACYEENVADEDVNWLFFALPGAMKEGFLSQQGRSDLTMEIIFINSHFLLVQHVTAYWRDLVQHLQTEIVECEAVIAFAAPGEQKANSLRPTASRLQALSDQLRKTKIAVAANDHALQYLRQIFLHTLQNRKGPESHDLELELTSQASQISEGARHILLQIESLESNLASCMHMASNFWQLANGKALEDIATTSARDATTVKYLTYLAALLLPTTFILNFFSTSFVSTVDDRIKLTKDWWLFLALGAPVTLVILAAWTVRTRYLRTKTDKQSSC